MYNNFDDILVPKDVKKMRTCLTMCIFLSSYFIHKFGFIFFNGNVFWQTNFVFLTEKFHTFHRPNGFVSESTDGHCSHNLIPIPVIVLGVTFSTDVQTHCLVCRFNVFSSDVRNYAQYCYIKFGSHHFKLN